MTKKCDITIPMGQVRNIFNDAYRLDEIRAACLRLGNETLAIELFEIIKSLKANADAVGLHITGHRHPQ